MCPVEISSAIPRGFRRLSSIGISLAVLAALSFNAQGHTVSDIRMITELHRAKAPRRSLEAAAKSQHFLSNEEILIGQRGDSWGSRNGTKDSSNSSVLGSDKLDDRNCSVTRIDGAPSTRRRTKRSVVHLYNMVVCATGCNPISYKGYGCYCGFLGSGSAVDGIDQCCRMHDRCYDATECPGFLQYFVPYYWKCYRGHKPICAVEHGKWGGSGSCAQRLCECDRALSECLRRFPCPKSKAVCTTSPWRLIQNIFMIF